MTTDEHIRALREALAAGPTPPSPPEPDMHTPEQLTDEQIVALRDQHLPSQGEPFDCIAFARAILRAQANTPTPVGYMHPEDFRDVARGGWVHTVISGKRDSPYMVPLYASPLVAEPAAPPTAHLACGHPASLMLCSAETGEPLYCELCDDKAGRRDAEARESDLLRELAAERETTANLVRALREATEGETFMGEPVLSAHPPAARRQQPEAAPFGRAIFKDSHNREGKPNEQQRTDRQGERHRPYADLQRRRAAGAGQAHAAGAGASLGYGKHPIAPQGGWGAGNDSAGSEQVPDIAGAAGVLAAGRNVAQGVAAEPGELPPLPVPLVMVNRYGASASTADGDGGVFTAEQIRDYARLALATSPLPRERVDRVMAAVADYRDSFGSLDAICAILEGRA